MGRKSPNFAPTIKTFQFLHLTITYKLSNNIKEVGASVNKYIQINKQFI